jgi:acyl-CoA synthetase (NDP forming)
LFDVAALLANQPVPAGRRVAVLTNAGGPGILAADACEANGLELTTLSAGTTAALRTFLPAAASVGNPVDILASASPEQYGQAARLLIADAAVDSLLVIFIPPLVTKADEVARAVVAATAGSTKPVLANFISSHGAPPEIAPIPSYVFPESAVTALAHVTDYGDWRRRSKGTIPQFADVRPDAVRGVIDAALARGEGWLTPVEGERLLAAVGISTAFARVVTTPEEAVAAAEQIGYPLALKAVGPEILHKTEVGGVILGIADAAALAKGFHSLRSRVGDAMTGALVQQMVPGGVEMLVGALVDPIFGPVLACGSGGVLVEVLRDSVFRLHPLTDVDAAEMVAAVKGATLLRGYRGHAPADEPALVETILRLSALLELCPEINELDINPLKVLEHGTRAVDARIRVSRREIAAPSRRISY